MSVEQCRAIVPVERIDPIVMGKVKAFAHCLTQTTSLEKAVEEGQVMTITEEDQKGKKKCTLYPDWLQGMHHINFTLFCDIRDSLGIDTARRIVQTHRAIQQDIPSGIRKSFQNE